jgi:hypothetical protein
LIGRKEHATIYIGNNESSVRPGELLIEAVITVTKDHGQFYRRSLRMFKSHMDIVIDFAAILITVNAT